MIIHPYHISAHNNKNTHMTLICDACNCFQDNHSQYNNYICDVICGLILGVCWVCEQTTNIKHTIIYSKDGDYFCKNSSIKKYIEPTFYNINDFAKCGICYETQDHLIYRMIINTDAINKGEIKDTCERQIETNIFNMKKDLEIQRIYTKYPDLQKINTTMYLFGEHFCSVCQRSYPPEAIHLNWWKQLEETFECETSKDKILNS